MNKKIGKVKDIRKIEHNRLRKQRLNKEKNYSIITLN